MPRKLQFLAGVTPSMVFKMAWARATKVLRPGALAERLAALDDQAILARFGSRNRPTEFRYSIFNADDYGDILGNTGRVSSLNPLISPMEPSHLSSYFQSIMSEFKAKMDAKGVRIMFANCPYVYTRDLNHEEISRQEARFAVLMSPFGEFIDHREANLFPTNYFFDSSLHLNTEGREIRTARLVAAIKAKMASGSLR